MGEQYHVETKNQTVNITITPLNATEVVKALQENNSNHIDEGIMISSATIIGFYGFGSFLMIRLEGNNVREQGQLLSLIYFCVTLIIILHLFVLLSVVLAPPINQIFYGVIIGTTVALTITIFSLLSELIKYKVEDAEDRNKTIHRVKARADQFKLESARK